ncbi:hypothetical protein ACRTGI_003051 [Clostridium perfringens]
MVNEQFFKMSRDIEEATIKLARSIKEIGIDNVDFEYMKGSNFYEISIAEYKKYWQIVHRERNKPYRADIFRMGFEDKKMTYQWSEED